MIIIILLQPDLPQAHLGLENEWWFGEAVSGQYWGGLAVYYIVLYKYNGMFFIQWVARLTLNFSLV